MIDLSQWKLGTIWDLDKLLCAPSIGNSLLDVAAIRQLGQAMVYLRTLNSRMKDFHDVWLLASQLTFDGAVLAKAIAATFANRATAIDAAPIAFTPAFTKQASTLAQWTAFRSKLRNPECPARLSEVVVLLTEFLLPIARACADGEGFTRRWAPGGPWTTSS